MTRIHACVHAQTCVCVYLDVAGVSQEHGHSVNAEAPSPCGRQSILKSSAEVLIYQLRLIVSCSLVLGVESGGRGRRGGVFITSQSSQLHTHPPTQPLSQLPSHSLVHTPWLAYQTSPSAQLDRSILCTRCKSPSDTQRAQTVPLVRPLTDACRVDNQQDKLTHKQERTVQALTHHFAKGLMICGWSQMKVGLTQSTSTNSPTS